MRTAADIAALLESVFARIETERMIDVPILNTALSVEAVGFREIDTDILGVLITPWFMNLMLVPGESAGWEDEQPGATSLLELPAGTFEFIAGCEAGIGNYRMCSLFSPVFEFADQATAVATADAVMAELFESTEEDEAPPPPRRVSRRELFRGLAAAE